MSDQQIWGLHLFRTKARCINCHNGPLLTDGQFHNVGLTYYGREYEDLGLYRVTKKPEDVGKFKTPGLRDVHAYPAVVSQWLVRQHRRRAEYVQCRYAAGERKPEQENDPLFPKTSPHLKKLNLSKDERDAVISFLDALTTVPQRVDPPELPH